ncbi:MAG: arylesterase, partial [Proteobacteria bacterium]
MRSVLFLGPLLAMSTIVGGTANAATPAKVLVVGDSLSAAYGLNMEQGWVSLLEQR